MDTVVRALAIYFGLLVILRWSGHRSLSQVTTFDFVLLLILGESTQQALVGDDYSLTTGLLLIVTLVGTDMTLSYLKLRSPRLDRWLEGLPIVIVEHGKPLRDRMRRARVDDADILAAARELQGLERMDQIKYAVLERSGDISIVPAQPQGGS